MTVNILFAAQPERWDTYEQALRSALSEAGIDAQLSVDLPPAEVDYIIYAPNSAVQDFTPFTRAKAKTLGALGFNVTGWSRSPKVVAGVSCLHGSEGLTQALSRAEIAVLLLPNTPATQNTLNAETLGQMPRGSFIINPGRGPLIDDDALLSALDSGQIAHATLDVFRVEPLPAEHPYWAHRQVTVTPHIAAETRAVTASQAIAENIRRGEVGDPFLNLVDRALGY